MCQRYAVESVRSIRMPKGRFSPASISLRTTVNSDARSSALMKLFTIRSASSSSAHARLSSVAGNVSK